ncbi:hypothetical protein FN846DRAFT_951305 [Sphaerosporella brunnea]|uniref:N-acetyltransferase domain-containing protein n=1 Tax=Sphaerosporella brunnea TaxID=1250544 RepID=A0A5J5EW82_9PEZI|nr:hypothetical protein FN846DRAFT_951305 [Sphaerosporella brunnea]
MPLKHCTLPHDTHVFVRPLTPRDTDACDALSAVSATPPLPKKDLYDYLRRDSPTSLGVFTCPPLPDPLMPHADIMLGYVIGDTDDGNGEGSTLRIVGLWVLPEQETTGVAEVLLRGWCDRMRDGRVARKIVKEGEEDARRREWYRDAGFAVRGEKEMLVMDCY